MSDAARDAALGAHGAEREDETDDSIFYREPRMVAHIDEHAIAEVTALYRSLLAPLGPRGRVLDVMSSLYSHLPEDVQLAEVIGLGMNAEELAENPQLTHWVTQNLNVNPALPFADNTFDAALNTVSVQYLTRPVAVFSEVARVLRPGAFYAVTFSNRMFATKAVRAWRSSDEQGRIDLVRSYFQHTGRYGEPQVVVRPGTRGRWPFPDSDPLYAVIAQRTR